MLDLRTLALITMMSAVVFFLATLMVWRLLPQERGLRDWMVASLLMAASTLLLGLRGMVPDFLSIVVANSLLVLSLGFIHVGSRHLVGVGIGRPWHWLAGAAMFLACLVFTYLLPHLPARIIALSLLVIPFFFASGLLFLRHREPPLVALDGLTALIFMIGALLFLARAAIAPSAVVSADYTSTPSPTLALPYFYSILFNVWMAIMLTLKVSARLQRRLAEALDRAEVVNRELNETLGFNEAILLNSPLPIGVYAASGRCILANDAYANFVGATREALLAQNFHDIVAWRESGVLEDCQTALAQHRPQQREAHLVSSFGKELWFEYRMLPTHINGEVHLLIQFFDLTERKLIEQSLRSRKEQLLAILNASTESIFHVDRDGIILAINEMASRRVHKTVEEMLGKCAFEFFPAEVAAGRRAHLAEVFRSGVEMRVEDAREDHFFSLNYYPILGDDGAVASVVVYATDITERRQYEQTLERILAEQAAILETDLVGIVRVTKRTVIWANPAFEKMLGYGSGELDGTPTRQNYPDEAAYQAFGAAAYPVLSAGKVFRAQIEHVRKDGKHIWVDISGVVLNQATGESLWAFVDITERRMLEQIVAQSEQRMELALAGADLGLWDLDLRSGRFSHNPRLVTMVGYQPEEVALTDKVFLSLLHPEDAPGFGAAFFAHLKGETPNFEFEYRVRHKDDHWVWIHSGGKVVERDENGRALRMTGTNLDISERKAGEAALKAREERLSTLIASMQDQVFVFDTGGEVVEYFQPPHSHCPSWKPREEIVGATYAALFPADVAGLFDQAIGEIMMAGQPQTFEYRLSIDGMDCDFHATLSQLAGEGKYPTGFLAVVRDITERKLAEQELRIAATAFETREGLMVTDSRGVILRVNRAFSEMTGYSAAEAVGKTPAVLRSGHHDEAFYRQLWTTLQARKFWDGEIWDRRKNGEVFPEWLTISAVSGPDGGVTHYVGIFSDITDRKLAEEKIHNLAFYDPLTQLPNRRLLLDRLGQAQSASARRESHGAILFLDLDNFKTLNDTLGHETGDLLLIEVAKRMVSCVRAEDTVARLGGDEFVVVLEDLDRDERVAAVQAMDVAEKIRKALNLPYQFKGHIHQSSPSIGVCLYKGTEVPISELLMSADKAMYQSKAGGRNRACLSASAVATAEHS